MLKDKNILLIISGGISAYKTLDLIRLIKKNNGNVKCILTKAGEQFVTPLSVAALSENKAYTDIWSDNNAGMDHINLSREADLIIVAPASADIIAKMAHGLANDLASTTLLAANKSIIIAPAMNPEMWNNAATQANIKTLKQRGILQIGPNAGDMACNETGEGRMSEPEEIFTAITDFFFEKPLKGYKALVTSGPTYESIDPVRFLGNRSSGKQGHAIAKSLRDAGANVTLISGPTNLNDPCGIKTVHIESAKEMLEACSGALPADIAICAAAVSDWTPTQKQCQKIKKTSKNIAPNIELTQSTDILHMIASHKTKRPKLVIGFAAETQKLEENATAKLASKKCDWIIANEVGLDENGVEKTFASDQNQIYFISQNKIEKWARASKDDIACKLIQQIVKYMDEHDR